jgi:hypothetical protein
MKGGSILTTFLVRRDMVGFGMFARMGEAK